MCCMCSPKPLVAGCPGSSDRACPGPDLGSEGDTRGLEENDNEAKAQGRDIRSLGPAINAGTDGADAGTGG
jgi:hypothetical protein